MQRNSSAPLAEPADPVAWTVCETACRLGIKRSAAYAYVKAGILPSIKLGGHLLITAATVRALVDEAMSQWGVAPMAPDAGRPRTNADACLTSHDTIASAAA